MKYVLLFVEEEEFARDLEAMGPAERARAYQRVAEWMDTHAGWPAWSGSTRASWPRR